MRRGHRAHRTARLVPLLAPALLRVGTPLDARTARVGGGQVTGLVLALGLASLIAQGVMIGLLTEIIRTYREWQ